MTTIRLTRWLIVVPLVIAVWSIVAGRGPRLDIEPQEDQAAVEGTLPGDVADPCAPMAGSFHVQVTPVGDGPFPPVSWALLTFHRGGTLSETQSYLDGRFTLNNKDKRANGGFGEWTCSNDELHFRFDKMVFAADAGYHVAWIWGYGTATVGYFDNRVYGITGHIAFVYFPSPNLYSTVPAFTFGEVEISGARILLD